MNRQGAHRRDLARRSSRYCRIGLTRHIPTELIIAVRAGTIVISLMVIAAIGTRGHAATMVILAGALLFFLSDL